MEHLFLVSDNNMSPYLSKGDLAIFEPMQLGSVYNSVYLVEYRGKKMVVRVQLLIRGDMLLIFDSGDKKTIRFKSHERMRVVFIGHVIARFTRDKELKKDYPFSFNQLYLSLIHI